MAISFVATTAFHKNIFIQFLVLSVHLHGGRNVKKIGIPLIDDNTIISFSLFFYNLFVISFAKITKLILFRRHQLLPVLF